MVNTIRIDGCADHMNKKTDLIIKKHKIITSENLARDSSDGC